VADRLNAAGVPCDLVTGQEVVRVPGARHVACTVEMAGLEAPVEVCVGGGGGVWLCVLVVGGYEAV
jgi:ATP-dependent RNA helicase SUPV3L1/SUV3